MTYHQHLNTLKYFESSDGKMAYVDEGQGEVILLVHGVPTSSWLYRKIIPILAENGYRVIAPDMIGFGQSDKPDAYELYSAENTGRRLLELMDYLNIESWSQVFHDGGGLWTWYMLKLDASRVRQLFMLNTIVCQEGFKPPLKFEEGIIAKLFVRMYSVSFLQAMAINPTFKNGIHNKSVVNAEMLQGYKTPLLKNGHHGLYYFFTQTCQKIDDYSALHQSLNIPRTVIWGKHDDMLVWEDNAPKIKANFNIEAGDIHLLDAKHFIQEERPEEIAKIILAKMNER